MIDLIILSAVQMRIVLMLFLDGEVGTAMLLRKARVSGRTWTKEKDVLRTLGLVSSERRRVFSQDGVKLMHFHRLTVKGEEIAGRIVEISDSLKSERAPQASKAK